MNLSLESLNFLPVAESDFEDLLAIRIEAMKPSLERIGRFDASRARERFRSGFAPECTWYVVAEKERAGFVALKLEEGEMLLEHLYMRPIWQDQGVGGAVLKWVFDQADAKGISVRVGALRESASNRFYVRHGFVKQEESEWDIYYLRRPCA